jgi:hypothetical protein
LELFEAGDLTEVGEKGITLRYVDRVFPPNLRMNDAEFVTVADKR